MKEYGHRTNATLELKNDDQSITCFLQNIRTLELIQLLLLTSVHDFIQKMIY
jgi:hypothetical protein